MDLTPSTPVERKRILLGYYTDPLSPAACLERSLRRRLLEQIVFAQGSETERRVSHRTLRRGRRVLEKALSPRHPLARQSEPANRRTMARVAVFDHPLVQHKLTVIRDQQCDTKVFREVVDELSWPPSAVTALNLHDSRLQAGRLDGLEAFATSEVSRVVRYRAVSSRRREQSRPDRVEHTGAGRLVPSDQVFDVHHLGAAGFLAGYNVRVDSTRERLLREALRQIAANCPRLVRQCYWAGTSAISLEETRHRESFDLDFHTLEALADTRPVLSELQRAFPGALEIVQPPDADGSGFSCVLRLSEGDALTLQVFAGFETVPESDLVATSLVPRLRRITLARYLFDKVQCVLERVEARDLVDIGAVLKHRPNLEGVLRRAVTAQDALLMAERLLAWTGESIREDLRAYPDVDPHDAIAVRDRLLQLVKNGTGR